MLVQVHSAEAPMLRKNLRLCLDCFFAGAAVPVVFLVLWNWHFEHASFAAQDRFLRAAVTLWPTSLQILVVPHGESSIGYGVTIAIMVVQNAILYAIIGLVVHWLVARMRHPRIKQAH
jgi:hypothetical protein